MRRRDRLFPRTDDKPQIHNGADDNASGTATVLEIASILANFPMKYTVRFCLFARFSVCSATCGRQLFSLP